jgi:hypothetical protein
VTELKFEDPPPPKRAPRGFEEIAQKLKDSPGKWAVIAVYPDRSGAGSQRMRVTRGLTRPWQPAGDFEATARAIDGEYRLYARYMGDGGQGDE